MFCIACAATNPPNAGVCRVCGADLRGSSRPRPASPSTLPATAPRRQARLAVVLLPVLLLIGVGGEALLSDQLAAADRARAYARGSEAAERGDYVTAAVAFADAGGYRDAPARRRAMEQALAPYTAAYDAAVAALDARRHREAVDLLLPIVRDLPTFADAGLLLEQARLGLAADLERQASAAESAADWLAAEGALAELAALAPDDPAVTDRLAALRRDRAPLVFTRDRALYVASPDGTDERLLVEGIPALWPTWSPDRQRIAFVSPEPTGRPYDGTLYVVNRDGSGLRELARRVLPRNNWPSWSPDGTRIAYTSFAEFDEFTETGIIAIHVVDVATGVETDLTGDRLPHASSVAWAPGGDRVAFVSRPMRRQPDGSLELPDGDVFVLDLASGDLTNVSRGRIVEEWRVAWSPVDDRLLVFTLPGDWTSPERSEIILLDLDADTVASIPTDAWEVAIPFWSPDGSRFAYVEGSHTVRLWSTQGEEWVRLETAIGPYLSWSPDGTSLLAPAADGQGPSYVIPLDGEFGSRRPIELDFDAMRGESGPPQWSPRHRPVPAAPPALAGTALDPGPEPARAVNLP